MSERPVLIVLHGPSGVGKDSVVDELRTRHGIHRPTSSTDRKPRPGETSDHYHFYTHDEFKAKVDAGEFAEWANVYGELKGLERREIEDALAAGKDVVIRTDVQGARTWRKALEGAVFVILVPESDEALRARLEGRNTDSPEKIRMRLEEWQQEKEDTPNNDYVIVNREGQLASAVQQVLEIIARERANTDRPLPRIRDEVPREAARG